MTSPLLTTKLHIPPVRPELVPRPRLIQRLNEGSGRKLTLISAPAGFGKTTLLSEWIHRWMSMVGRPKASTQDLQEARALCDQSSATVVGRGGADGGFAAARTTRKMTRAGLKEAGENNERQTVASRAVDENGISLDHCFGFLPNYLAAFHRLY